MRVAAQVTKDFHVGVESFETPLSLMNQDSKPSIKTHLRNLPFQGFNICKESLKASHPWRLSTQLLEAATISARPRSLTSSGHACTVPEPFQGCQIDFQV